MSGSRLGSTSPVVVAERLRGLVELIDDIGGECWASGPTAAALHGFDGWSLRPPFHVVIVRGRYVTRLGHVVHTTLEVPPIDRSVAHGIPVLSPTRTIVDLARHESEERLTVAVDCAIRDGGTSEDFLHRRIVAMRGRGRHGLPRLLDVLAGVEVTRGGQSWLEREFLRLLASFGLPRPVTQHVMGRRGTKLIRVDVWFEGTPLVVELLGYAFHRSPLQMQEDAARMNRLQLDGRVVLQFAYVDVVERPRDVIALVAEALVVTRGRPSAS